MFILHKKEKTILFSSWFAMLLIFVLFTPKNKIRQAHVAYSFKQFITWLFGLMVVKFKLIEYPVRLFKGVNKASFSFEFFMYPAICSLFNVHYPEQRNGWIKFLYHLGYTSFITGLEVIFERYTNLIKYHKWKWYYSFITLGLTFYLSRLYFSWFFRLTSSANNSTEPTPSYKNENS